MGKQRTLPNKRIGLLDKLEHTQIAGKHASNKPITGSDLYRDANDIFEQVFVLIASLIGVTLPGHKKAKKKPGLKIPSWVP